MRVMNLTSYPVTLSQGTVLGELEPVEVVDRRPSATSNPSVEVVGGLPDYIQTLLDEVDPTFPTEFRRQLIQLLAEYSAVFFQGDGDLGRATDVKHRIDTQNHRPFRKVLRRQPNVYLDVIDAEVDEMM